MVNYGIFDTHKADIKFNDDLVALIFTSFFYLFFTADISVISF